MEKPALDVPGQIMLRVSSDQSLNGCNRGKCSYITGDREKVIKWRIRMEKAHGLETSHELYGF